MEFLAPQDLNTGGQLMTLENHLAKPLGTKLKKIVGRTSSETTRNIMCIGKIRYICRTFFEYCKF